MTLTVTATSTLPGYVSMVCRAERDHVKSDCRHHVAQLYDASSNGHRRLLGPRLGSEPPLTVDSETALLTGGLASSPRFER